MVTQRQKLSNGRVFPVEELDGFYIDHDFCVHVTFEDDATIAIDIFNTPSAAYDGNGGEIIGHPIIINLRTGEISFEEAEGGPVELQAVH
jgi:hypothetical protein